MEIFFYLAATVAVAATARVISCSNTVHALLYLIVSLLSVAVVFYALGAPFAAVLEIIVYAGAIMVLFVFVIMMLNLSNDTIEDERHMIAPRIWFGPGVLAFALLIVMIFALSHGASLGSIDGTALTAREVGMTLFGPYVLVVELAAFVLLAALVVAAHLGRDDRDVERDVAQRRARPERDTKGEQR